METEAEHPPSQPEPGPALYFCHLCQSEYRQPKLLQCLHTFCMSCLQDVQIEETDGKLVICPLCTYPTPLAPSQGLESLTDNPFLQRISSDYVTGVKSNIAAKSLSPQAARKIEQQEPSIAISNTAGQRLGQEMTHLELANLTDEQKTVTSRNMLYKVESSVPEASLGFLELRRGSVDRGEYNSSSMEAINNMSRLQGKLMSLQGEALRVTYAIDRINEHMTNWYQHKEDLKREVQRRCNQFQLEAKKMERQIISQIDGKTMEDQVHSELDHGKSQLRQNLKVILHEVSILKSVNELGRFSEINDLSSSLLRPSIGIDAVKLAMPSYQLDIPTKSIEEMVSMGFGQLIESQEDDSVYAPDLRNYVNLPLDQLTPDYKQDQEVNTKTGADGEAESTASQRSRGRSSVARRRMARASGSKRYTSDIGVSRSDFLEHLEQFQSARESFRTRRQEILRQGQHAREDLSPHRGDGRKLSWPTFLRGRRPSLDKESHVTGDDNNTLSADKQVEKTDELRVSSPIIEEADVPGSPQKGVFNRFLPQMPSPGDRVGTQTNLFKDGRRRTTSLGSSSRQSSLEDTPPSSPTAEGNMTGDLRIKGIEGGRTLRKAVSSASDKRSKMEFLRENWQKRKEILIQSHGFVSSEPSGKSKPESAASAPAKVPLSQTGLVTSSAASQLSSDIIRQRLLSLANRKPTTMAPETQEKEEKKVDNDSEEEVTSTMTIPIKEKLLQDMNTNDIRREEVDDEDEEEVTYTTETFAIGQNKTTKITEEQPKITETKDTTEEEVEEEEEVIMTTETFSLGPGLITRNDVTESISSTTGSSTMASRVDASRIAPRANAVSSPTVGTSSTRSASYSTRVTSPKTMTMTSPNSPVLQSTIPVGTTIIAPSPTLTTSAISSSTSSTSTRLGTIKTTATTMSTMEASKTSSSTTPNLQSLSTPFSYYATRQRNETSTENQSMTNTSTAITTSSSSPLTMATTSSRPTQSPTTTTTTAAAATATTTTTSYLGRPSRRYVPRTETIDVAALLANLYKPSSSITPKEPEKKEDDEEKENKIKDTEKQLDKRTTKDQNNFQTTIASDQGVIKYTFSPNNSMNTEKASVTDRAPSTDFKRTQGSDVTVYKITGDNNMKPQSQSKSSYVSPHVPTNPLSSTYPTSMIQKSNETVEEQARGATQPPSPLLPGSPRDQKVNETFNQVESNRKRYKPATSRSSARSSRRHTVEISKTIPEGMRLSDLYQPAGTTVNVKETDALRSRDAKSDVQWTVIEESQDEYTKDHVPPTTTTLSLTGARESTMYSRSDAKQPQDDSSSSSTIQSESATAGYSSASSDSTEMGANLGASRGKLRDVARKKKDRWRRLTIS